MDVGYLTRDMLEHVHMVSAQQLKYSAVRASQRRHMQAIGEMFLTELKFAADCLMRWFVIRFKSVYLEIDLQAKGSYGSKNPLDWDKGKSVNCNSLLSVDGKGVDSLTTE